MNWAREDRAANTSTWNSAKCYEYFRRNFECKGGRQAGLADRESVPVHEQTPWRDDLPWGNPYQLTPFERSAIEESIQQFQLGTALT